MESPKYTVQVLQLSGASCRISLPESALVSDILLEMKRQTGHRMRRRLLFQGRVLGDQETLMSLAIPGELEMQLICHPYHAERLQDSQMTQMTQTFHFTLCGEHQVGKSSLLWRYAENVFREDFTHTAGHNFKTISLMAEDTPVKLFLWDWPTGEERFRPAPSLFFRQKTAVMLVVDLTNPACLEDVEHWLSMMKPHSIRTKLLVGNKADLNSERRVQYDDAERFATDRGMYYFETSAKEGTGVAEAIEFAVFDALEKTPKRVKPTPLPHTQSKPSCYVQ